eukprot:4171734-Amphidinium_carterae.1
MASLGMPGNNGEWRLHHHLKRVAAAHDKADDAEVNFRYPATKELLDSPSPCRAASLKTLPYGHKSSKFTFVFIAD